MEKIIHTQASRNVYLFYSNVDLLRKELDEQFHLHIWRISNNHMDHQLQRADVLFLVDILHQVSDSMNFCRESVIWRE